MTPFNIPVMIRERYISIVSAKFYIEILDASIVCLPTVYQAQWKASELPRERTVFILRRVSMIGNVFALIVCHLVT